MEFWTFIVAAVTGLLCLPPCLEALGLRVRIFGSKPMAPSKGRWVTLLVITIVLLIISSAGLYRTFYKELNRNEMQLVSHRTFANEEVEVDGKNFVDCTFNNATVVFKGTKRFYIDHSHLAGTIRIRAEDRATREFTDKIISLILASPMRVSTDNDGTLSLVFLGNKDGSSQPQQPQQPQH